MKKVKQADAIADPEVDEAEFVEGWREALEKEKRGVREGNLIEEFQEEVEVVNGVKELSLVEEVVVG